MQYDRSFSEGRHTHGCSATPQGWQQEPALRGRLYCYMVVKDTSNLPA